MARLLLVALALLAAPATAIRTANATAALSTFTVNDKIYVGGGMYAEGSAIGNLAGTCQAANSVSVFKVCGCNVKVIAHLLSECQTYKQYDTQIGHCNCANSGCDEKTLSSGYSEPFNWQATSFDVLSC
mmetsp:Transcript_62184/g.163327  ORF Transcript_62184/g.163327 Transcript_62184/m.163327 type:complete len:129 (-) Transcript_62184:50-436(-)